jgi:ADP-ribose pyrophosphatase YjhB (NUDIX family)
MKKKTAKPSPSPTRPDAGRGDDRRYPSRPYVGVGVIIWRGDRVLLIRRGKPPRKDDWGLPGGMQDIGETIIEAACREAREETGLDIEPLGIVTAIDGISYDKDGRAEFHYTIVEVAAESREGEAEARSDVLGVRWATLDEVERLCGWEEVHRVVRLSALQRAL